MDYIGPWRESVILSNCLKRMAGTTRLELATSAVTGQRSNQLNYVPTAKTNDLRKILQIKGLRICIQRTGCLLCLGLQFFLAKPPVNRL